ncbi:hypothetical protein Bca4012_009487 [Brassica carinata]
MQRSHDLYKKLWGKTYTFQLTQFNFSSKHQTFTVALMLERHHRLSTATFDKGTTILEVIHAFCYMYRLQQLRW